MEQTKLLEAKYLCRFLQTFTKEMKKEFYRIIGSVRIITEKIFEPYEFAIENKAFMGKFHQFFIQKVIRNLQDKDWRECDLFFQYAKIFPFKVRRDVDEVNLDIFGEFINSGFNNEIKQFLTDHFDDISDDYVDEIVKLFLRNIHYYQTFDTERKTADGEALPSKDHDENNDLSNTIVKLTDKGAERYSHLCKLTQQAMKVFSPKQEKMINFEKYNDDYFRNISKTNFVELYSLLDVNFYRKNSKKYKELFEKFIFFFTSALENDEDPILFFIDDILYECLKSLHVFVKSRESPINLKSQIGNLTSIYQRIFIDSEAFNENHDIIVSDQSLRDIENYFKTGVRGINTAEVTCTVLEPMYSTVFACTRHEIIEVCFSGLLKDKMSHFIHGILFSAFSQKFYNRICIYNIYTGIKTWLYTPSCKDEILRFVQKYHIKANDEEPMQFMEDTVLYYEEYFIKPSSSYQ